MSRVDYSPEQVTMALMSLVANGGDVKATAEELIDDEFQVPVTTLRTWKDRTHAERYRELELKYGEELERMTIEKLRRNADRAAQIEAELLEEIARGVPMEQRAQALRAVADSRSKSVDKLLAMTGRDPGGRGGETDLVGLMRSLAAKGLVKVNVELGAGEEPATDAEVVGERPAIEAPAEP